MKVHVEYNPQNGNASHVWDVELAGVPRQGDFVRVVPQDSSQRALLEDGDNTLLLYVLAVVWTPRGDLPADLVLAVDLASKAANRGEN